MQLTISRKFDTRVEKSSRVLEVAEAFGLGLSDKQFVIYDDLKIDIRSGDVVYICGESGSGKSLLLRDLSAQLAAAGQHVADIMDVPLLDMPLVDQIGQSTDQALKLLSQAGLNDAYLFIRKPSELSDGQKYRFRLAKLIEQGADVWVADEFAAVLDRQTAKVVAHNMAKSARQAGATLIVATTHTDLLPYLGASLAIEKLFGNRVEVERLTWGNHARMCQEPGCHQYALIGEKHCAAHKPKPVKKPKTPKQPKKPKQKPAESSPGAPGSSPDTQELSA